MSVPQEDCCEAMLILAKFLNLSHSLLLLFTNINSDLPRCQSLCTSVFAIGQSLTLAVLQTAANTIIPHHEFHVLPLVLFWFAKSKSMASGRFFQWVLSARPPISPAFQSPVNTLFLKWMNGQSLATLICSYSAVYHAAFLAFFHLIPFPHFSNWYRVGMKLTVD